MNAVAPPLFTNLTMVDDGGSDRLRLRLKQLSWATTTVAVTAWVCTYGPFVGIMACAVAKHVLVAIVLMGVGLDRPRHPG